MAKTAVWRRTKVTRYGVTETVDLAVIRCLWWGSLHRTPIRVVLVRDLDETKPYTLALATTDLTSTAEQIAARHASRWSIQQSIKDAENLLGAGDAQNRLPAAVERTTPLGLANLTILILRYDHAGQPATDLNSRRMQAPWYRHKRHVSIQDMITAFLRATNARRRMAVLLISHAFAIIGEPCSRVLVMYAGRIAEALDAESLEQPAHPYARALVGTNMDLDIDRERPLVTIPGQRRESCWSEDPYAGENARPHRVAYRFPLDPPSTPVHPSEPPTRPTVELSIGSPWRDRRGSRQ